MAIFKSIRRLGRKHKDDNKSSSNAKKKDALLNYSFVSNGYSTSSTSSGNSPVRKTTPSKTKKPDAVLVEASLPLFHPSMRTSSLWTYDEMTNDGDDTTDPRPVTALDRLQTPGQASHLESQPEMESPFMVNEDDWDCSSGVSMISTRTFSSEYSNNAHPSNEQMESQQAAATDSSQLQQCSGKKNEKHRIHDTVVVTVVSRSNPEHNQEAETSQVSSTPTEASNGIVNDSIETDGTSKGGNDSSREEEPEENVSVEVIARSIKDIGTNKVQRKDRIVRILKRMDQKDNTNSKSASVQSVGLKPNRTKSKKSHPSNAAISIVKTTTNTTDPHKVSHIFEDESSTCESSMGSSNVLNENDFRILRKNATPTMSTLLESPSLLIQQPGSTTKKPKPDDDCTAYSPTSVTFQAMFDAEDVTQVAPDHPCASPEATVTAASEIEPKTDAPIDTESKPPVVHQVCDHSVCDAVTMSPTSEIGATTTHDVEGRGCHSCLSSPHTMSENFQDSIREIQREVHNLYLKSPLAPTKTPTAAGNNGATDDSATISSDVTAALDETFEITPPIKLSKYPITSILNSGKAIGRGCTVGDTYLTTAASNAASGCHSNDKEKFFFPRTKTQASI